MATIYVRTTGNDTTGTGLTGAPYLTIKKALSVAVAGDLVLVGDGTYVEDSGSGYLAPPTTYGAAGVTVAPESGLPDKVIVSGAGTDYVMIPSGVKNLTFDNITFRAQAATVLRVIRLQGSMSNVEFRRCRIQAWGTSNGCIGSSLTAATLSAVRFVKCSFEQIGTGAAFGISVDGSAATSVSDVQIRDCTVVVGNYGIRLQGVTALQVHNVDVECIDPSVAVHALQVGVDGETGALCSGSVLGGNFRTMKGHAAVIGAGVDGMVVIGGRFYGGADTGQGQGLVVKQALNALIERCVIYAGYLSGLYFKAAQDCQAFDNIVINEYANSSAFRVQRNTTNSAACARLTVRRNKFVAVLGTAVDFGTVLDDTGGSYVDENVYVVRAAAALGSVRGTTVTTLSGLRAAWATYDRNNDRNSKIGVTNGVFAGVPFASLPPT